MKEKNKYIISGILILTLIITLTIFSNYHVEHLGKIYPQFLIFMYGITLISISLGGFISYLFQKKIELKEFEKYLVLLSINERKILKLLFERKEIEQNKLVSLSGLNNVKVSRIITLLESKNLIKKKVHGYTNLIILK